MQQGRWGYNIIYSVGITYYTTIMLYVYYNTTQAKMLAKRAIPFFELWKYNNIHFDHSKMPKIIKKIKKKSH